MAISEVHNSVGMREAYYYFRKNSKLSKEISETMYRRIIRAVNNYIQEEIANCNDFDIPCNLGRIEVRKRDSSLYFDSNNKLVNTKPVDWKATKEMWERKPYLKEQKKLVRFDVNEVFKIHFRKGNKVYINKHFFEFTPNRFLKRKLKNNIIDRKVDAFNTIYYGK